MLLLYLINRNVSAVLTTTGRQQPGEDCLRNDVSQVSFDFVGFNPFLLTTDCACNHSQGVLWVFLRIKTEGVHVHPFACTWYQEWKNSHILLINSRIGLNVCICHSIMSWFISPRRIILYQFLLSSTVKLQSM